MRQNQATQKYISAKLMNGTSDKLKIKLYNTNQM